MLELAKRNYILQARREVISARARGDAAAERTWCAAIDRVLDEYWEGISGSSDEL